MLEHIEQDLQIWGVTYGGSDITTGYHYATVLYRIMRQNGTALPSIKLRSTVAKDDVIAEKMESAILRLPATLKHPVIARYAWGVDDTTGSRLCGCAPQTYRQYINLAKHWIDGYLRQDRN